jgi:uncharacterized membrane protein HdeD (DUF308 family)
MEVEVITKDDLRDATGGWWLFMLIGFLGMAVGVTILAKPGDSLSTLAVIAGIFLLVAGILELIAALLHGTQSRGMVALLGVLTSIVGVLLIRHPIEGVTAIALLIGIWLIAVGVLRCVAAFEVSLYRGWNILVGVIELVAGIVIVSSPDIGFATLALLVGIGFIANGIGIFALGLMMRGARREAAASGAHLGAAT